MPANGSCKMRFKHLGRHCVLEHLVAEPAVVPGPPAERQALADAIARMSPVSRQHITLQWEVDFSDEAMRFDLGALLTVEWEAAEG